MNMRHALRIILSITTLGIASSAVASDMGNPVQGQQLFSRCSGCHSVKGENKPGPPLNGVVGRKAASIESYRYSTALATSGIIWSEEALDNFLAGPTKFVRGTRMNVTVVSVQDRLDLIAYLKSLGSS